MIRDVKEYYEKSKKDHKYFCERGLYILTDEPSLLPFKFNPIQTKLHEFAENQIKERGYIRAIVLKARRAGLSTYVASRAFNHTFLNYYTVATIIAHEFPSTTRIFRMVKTFYDKMDIDEEDKPSLKRNNQKILEYEDNNSFLEVFTAGKENSARSGGYTFCHNSETAYHPTPLQFINIIQGIKRIAGTEIWIESTANGVGDFFHDRYWSAKKSASTQEDREKLYQNIKSESEYLPIFFAWYDDPKNQQSFGSVREKENFMESVENLKYVDRYGEELDEMRLYNLSWEQLKWRRWYIEEVCMGHPTLQPLDYFKQENPGNDIEAFVTTGGCVFKTTILLHNEKLCKPPIARGGLRWRNVELIHKQVDFYDDPMGELRIYQQPDSEPYKDRYCSGYDPSGSGQDLDPACGYVMDRLHQHRKIVAVWHGIGDSDKLAEQLEMLAIYYNRDIKYCIENSAFGLPIINYLKPHYTNFYLNRKIDKRTEKINSDVIGFKTTGASKNPLIAELNRHIREGDFDCFEKEFWEECLTFVRGKKYRLGSSEYYEMSALNKGKKGSKRNYDDRVIAMALTFEVDRVMNPPKKSFDKLPDWMKREMIKSNQPSSWKTA